MVLVMLTACQGKKSKTGGFFGASGQPLEMVAVLPDGYDTPALRDSIRVAFSYPMQILPQEEALVKVMMTGESNFTQMFKAMRNVLYITIDKEMYTKPSIGISRDQFADGQLLIHARAESLESIYVLLRQRGAYLAELIHLEEVKRLSVPFETTYSSHVARLAEETFGNWSINVSNNFEYTNTAEDFLWASDQGQKGRTDFMLYSYPYTGAESLTADAIIAARDSVLKTNVPGQYEGSYMTTEKRVPPVVRQFELYDLKQIELRGLWAMVGDMMGGPYVLHAAVDAPNNRVMVAEMSVYNPGGKKKHLMLYAESQLYGLRPKDVPYAPLP
ncbi:MAG: DUF4837 family protein [Porphyromonas sp.]|nr:DUF4837 family protein [Porphyromonas sp.]